MITGGAKLSDDERKTIQDKVYEWNIKTNESSEAGNQAAAVVSGKVTANLEYALQYYNKRNPNWVLSELKSLESWFKILNEKIEKIYQIWIKVIVRIPEKELENISFNFAIVYYICLTINFDYLVYFKDMLDFW